MAAHRFLRFLSAVPARRASSVATPSSPLPPDSKSINKTVKTVITRKRRNNKENRSRGSLLHKPPHLRLRTRPHRSVPIVLAIPSLLHRGSRSSHVGAPQEVQNRRAAPLIRQEVPDTPLPLRPLGGLLDPRPQLGLLVLPPGTVLKQVVPRLLSATDVLRVAPPAVSSGRACPDLSW